jgi:hypothetical protein
MTSSELTRTANTSILDFITILSNKIEQCGSLLAAISAAVLSGGLRSEFLTSDSIANLSSCLYLREDCRFEAFRHSGDIAAPTNKWRDIRLAGTALSVATAVDVGSRYTVE